MARVTKPCINGLAVLPLLSDVLNILSVVLECNFDFTSSKCKSNCSSSNMHLGGFDGATIALDAISAADYYVRFTGTLNHSLWEKVLLNINFGKFKITQQNCEFQVPWSQQLEIHDFKSHLCVVERIVKCGISVIIVFTF